MRSQLRWECRGRKGKKKGREEKACEGLIRRLRGPEEPLKALKAFRRP